LTEGDNCFLLAGSPDREFLHGMNYQLLEEANKVVEDKQMLINAVSRRVRQLSSGVRPHVEVEPRMTYADVALAEIIAGRLTIEKPVVLEQE
jgi:DNA-directed RNA polymerase subunit omega